MKAPEFQQRSSRIFAENRLLKFMLIVLGAAVIIGNYMSYRAVKTQRTIIIPRGSTHAYTFDGYSASPEYVRDFSRDILNLAFNYTPITARSNFGQLLAEYSPEEFPSEKGRLYALADRIEANRITSAFYPYGITQGDKKIEIQGMMRQYQDRDVLVEEVRVIVIDYVVSDGRFFVRAINEKAGKSS